MRRQIYLGSATIAIYINDQTEMIKKKKRKVREERERAAMQQQENFTSTVSHEMRTPLATILFFL